MMWPRSWRDTAEIRPIIGYMFEQLARDDTGEQHALSQSNFNSPGEPMAISNKIRKQMLELCGSLCDDDGLDPRRSGQGRSEKKEDGHRQQRLCQQVARTLNFVFPESAARAIRGLTVAEVVPSDAASTLTVRIVARTSCSPADRRTLVEILKQQEGCLRSEVARAITRKKTPHLTFEFVDAPDYLQKEERSE